jgi:hypothetical protein
MSYNSKFIYIIILGLFANPLWAQDTRYRVEVLVLTHLRSVEPATEADELRDYSSALDFLTPVEEDEGEESSDETAEPSIAEEPEPEPAPEPDPNEVIHQEEMSDVMREAWRRLRLSAPFRPQQYLSWEQGNQEPFPVLRVHDLNLVLVKDPDARERFKMIEADLLESDSEKEARDKKREMIFTAPAGDSSNVPGEPPETPEEPEIPGPVNYYRLDGTVTLRRSRFLHLDLDLQLREGTWEPEPLEIISMDPVIYERAGPTSFLLHELRQSRQVKTERMEYFDGPLLSVLAFITAIKVDKVDAP